MHVQYSRNSDNITCLVCSLYNKASCFENVECHGNVQLVPDRLRSVEVCYISRFLIKHTLLGILQFWILEKEYLPQFRNTCFVVLVFLLL